jgi:hypothetical protein
VSSELGRSVKELRALSEVSQAVNSTLGLEGLTLSSDLEYFSRRVTLLRASARFVNLFWRCKSLVAPRFFECRPGVADRAIRGRSEKIQGKDGGRGSRGARSYHLLIIDRASSSARSRGPVTTLLAPSMPPG